MKKMKNFLRAMFCIVILVGCSEELEIRPTIDYISQEKEIVLDGKAFIQSTTTKVTYSPEGEVISAEIIAMALDGDPMAQDQEGNWILKYELSREPAVGGLIQNDPLACNYQIDEGMWLLFDDSAPSGLAAYCIKTIESTCYETYMEDGIMVTEVTYSISTTMRRGPC